MADLRISRYLRPRGVGWLLLGAIGVLLVVMPVRLHQRAEHIRQVVAAQEQLNQDLWRSLPGEPVAGLSDAMGEADARRFMRDFSQAQRQSLEAPECRWAELDDLFETVIRKGKLTRKRLAFAGDIVCSTSYGGVMQVNNRGWPNGPSFTTVWHYREGTWELAGARKSRTVPSSIVPANSLDRSNPLGLFKETE